MRTFTALVCLLGTSFALGQSCPVTVTGSAKLSDPHHVAYTVTVSNPTSRPVEYNARVDFFLKGVKLQGGYENLRGTIPAKGKKIFKGSEAFVDVLKGADQVKVTRIRTCK